MSNSLWIYQLKFKQWKWIKRLSFISVRKKCYFQLFLGGKNVINNAIKMNISDIYFLEICIVINISVLFLCFKISGGFCGTRFRNHLCSSSVESFVHVPFMSRRIHILYYYYYYYCSGSLLLKTENLNKENELKSHHLYLLASSDISQLF